MVCIGDPGSSIMESYFWDLKHKLLPSRETRCSGRRQAGGDHFGGLVGPRTVKPQLITTLELVWALLLDVFQVTLKRNVLRVPSLGRGLAMGERFEGLERPRTLRYQIEETFGPV